MDQYLLIPFLGEWTSIYQLFLSVNFVTFCAFADRRAGLLEDARGPKGGVLERAKQMLDEDMDDAAPRHFLGSKWLQKPKDWNISTGDEF